MAGKKKISKAKMGTKEKKEDRQKRDKKKDKKGISDEQALAFIAYYL